MDTKEQVQKQAEEFNDKIKELSDEECVAGGMSHEVYYCKGPECNATIHDYTNCWLIRKFKTDAFCPIKAYADRGEEWPFGK